MWLSKLVSFSAGLSFARFPICWQCRERVDPFLCRDAFRAADFLGLGPSLHLLDGVTHVFGDFSGTMTSSDSSELCGTGLRLSPSLACSPSTTDGRAAPRSRGFRADGDCERAELHDPGGCDDSSPTVVGASPWPSAARHGVGSSVKTFSGLHRPARSLGPLRFETTVARRPAKVDLPRGGPLLGQDLSDSSMSTHSFSPATSAGFNRRDVSPSLSRLSSRSRIVIFPSKEVELVVARALRELALGRRWTAREGGLAALAR